MAVPLERFWRTVNPATRGIAGYVPWWVLLETTGRHTGQARRTPLATGPFDGSSLAVVSGYGERAAFVRNIRSNPCIRIKRRGRWLEGTAEVVDPTPAAVERLGTYAKGILLRVGKDPKVVILTIRPQRSQAEAHRQP